MSPHHMHSVSRRRLLQFLPASPLFTGSAVAEALRPSDPVDWAPRELDKLIADPTQALDVFDFEPVMKKNVPPAHFYIMASMTTHAQAIEGFRNWLATAAGRCQQDRPAPRSSASNMTAQS